jgi:acetate kinase
MSDQAILVINSGSSSLKVAVIEPESGRVLTRGMADRVGSSEPVLCFGNEAEQKLPAGADHGLALAELFSRLSGQPISAVGHRVVHGGESFSESVLLDEPAIAGIRACVELAPLHNPANIAGIEAARSRFPDLPQVAVFDTAFHQTLPPKAHLYAVPYALYEQHRVRRFGFHGTSHHYVAGETARRLGKPLESLQLITAHLGNGVSACAVKAGRSLDTTMGFTPLEGLVMGTRSGDVDPNLHQFLAQHTGQSLHQISEMLNRQSGLLGLSGESSDMRTLLLAAKTGKLRAKLAIDVFCYRLAKGILGLCAALERVDALVFTGGIGEHAAKVRADTLDQLQVLGASVDPALNAVDGHPDTGRISADSSRLLALVVPTNEEWMIAREVARLIPAG